MINLIVLNQGVNMCFLNRFLLMALLALEIAAWMPGLEFVGYFPIRLFAGLLGFLNAAIRPLLLLVFPRITLVHVAIAAFFMNAALFFFVSTSYLGIHITSMSGGIIAFLLIWAASIVTNLWICLDTTHF